jgi:hypothetical protein
MSTAVTVWVPLVTAGAGLVAGVGAAMGATILTQRRTDRREDVRWKREQADRKDQWQRERDDRQEQWTREDSLRWLQNKQAAYARLMTALDDWDQELGFARAARMVDAEFREYEKLWPKELDRVELKRRGKAAREALALVQFMAPQEVGGLARRIIQDREEFQVIHLTVQPTDPADLNTRWTRLLGRRRELMTAMRDDLGLEISSETQMG